MITTLRDAKYLRYAAVAAPLAIVIAVAISVAPSFAGSTFLTAKQAERTYFDKAATKARFAEKSELPQQPIERLMTSTVDFGPVYSKTPFDIPGARAVFQTDSTTDVVVTFSGEATCVATNEGTGCPIQVTIDGSPAGVGKVNFLTSSADPQPKETVHTVVQTGVVTAGQHDIRVRYAGATDASVGLKLLDWNLVVQAYPGPDVVEEG
ncbi:MAG: hypothetical protein QOI10_2432 [Solirubrobacterales bacterium]|nr:hypothetical protein [Solirubrobacterales bacterium]